MIKAIFSWFLLGLNVAVWGQGTGYEIRTNIPYYEETTRKQDLYLTERCVLDVYYPDNIPNFPVVIWFHGGGLTSGEKFIPLELKEKGLGIVAVNYRLSPRVSCPAYIEDAVAAVAWTFKHIREFGGNPEQIFVSGHSAGAYLTGMIGLDKHWLEPYRIDADRIAGLFILSASTITHPTIRKERGIPDTQAIVDEYALVYHVRPDTPPLFLMTGDRELEMLGRYEENAYLWRMMKIVGNTQTVLYEFDGYGHDMLAPAFPLMLKHLDEICKKVNKNSIFANQLNNKSMHYNPLTPEEERIILHKGTEAPFSGEYVHSKGKGTYICKRCHASLYHSADKFDSDCGWPSFDDEIPGAVTRQPDTDGRRVEIICSNCGAHLGHVFLNEGFTPKNTRHCVNSLSLKFVPEMADTAYFASGCFWGTEYFMMKAPGMIHTAVGFMGGHVDHPTYEQVCTKTTGHVETTRVVFDANLTTYENLVKLFFETHDFTQVGGQGPDIGPQYRSVIFYANDNQKTIAEKYRNILTGKGYKVATSFEKASVFWKAEDYHQQYYEHKGSTPYCHIYKKIFD